MSHSELPTAGEGYRGVLSAVCRNPTGGANRTTTALADPTQEATQTQTDPS
jgi:hypothetical protein